jgi:hypothetical protein
MQKKMFTEPQMTKCETPLDKVTLTVGCYKGQNGIGDGGLGDIDQLSLRRPGPS